MEQQLVVAVNLLAACDFRLAREGIKAGFVQGKQAITTGWGGGTILTEKLPSIQQYETFNGSGNSNS